ncbi:MAG TPA: hypothetical protein QF468_00445 [Nitrospinota bacterium]|jgi:signal transduction histidine kinase|nr:hypothetical protein [Nitrospinota bacterium]|tara:strand:+ start:286 stop:459 length:174 start_codon:yes stop_codon:yes gene_type:complete
MKHALILAYAKNIIHRGFRLQGIEERAKMCGGILTIDSHSGKGTTLKVTVPVNKTGK